MENYEIPKIAQKYTEYDMILEHTNLPDFPKYRTSLLYVFLKNGALASSNHENVHELYSLVTSLVQMGLDTHDMVELENDQSNQKKMRSNQLKVLAGDYFSSRFYQLLAQKGQIDMIQRISNAICEVNRLKMNMYLNMQQMIMTAEDFLQQSILIKMQLFTPFSKMMKAAFAEKWTHLLYGLTRCEVIAEQIDLSQETESVKESWNFSNAMLHTMLDQQVSSILKQVSQLGSKKMIKELNRIGDPFLRYLTVSQVSEEI